MRRWLWLLVLVAGCSHRSAPPVKPPPSAFSASVLVDLRLETPPVASDRGQVLRGTDPTQSRALVWDGEVGANIGPYGFSLALDGSPLGAFRRGDYDQGENIRPLAGPLDFNIRAIDFSGARDASVRPMSGGYSQSLDLRYGLLTTHWFATVKGGFLEARISTFAAKGEMYTYAEFYGPTGIQLVIEPRSPKNPDWAVSSAWASPSVAPRAGVVGAGNATAMTLVPSGATWTCVAGPPGSSSPPANAAGFKNALLANHPLNRIDGSITIDGPLADQQAIDSFLYYLRTSIPHDGPVQISPFGLSSNRYNGHVFWDADVWVLPALALIEPRVLQAQVDYRCSRVRPPPDPPFPWESSVSGRETAPGESKKEIHISGSVLWGLEFAKALGARVPDTVAPRVADYYLARATKRPDGKVGLLGVMSPDENHTGPNDLYTNLVAQWAINGATWKPKATPPATMFLPADAASFLTYEGDRFQPYKQAAAVLAVYPLQYPPAEAEARAMMARFQDKIIRHGPAMSDSIHATIWARLGEPDKAYDLWRKSWGDFMVGPLMLFSEKRNSPTTYFTTGAAGCLQSVIYGFLGFRIDEAPQPGAAWKLPLKNGRWLSIKPNLPSAWKSVTFRDFVVLGHRYTLSVKREGPKTVTSVQQGD